MCSKEPSIPVELTEEQRKAVGENAGLPIEMVDPQTQRCYVLLASDQYDRIRPLVEGPAAAETELAIPEGIRRSQEAFWRELPELLAQRKLRRQWVCYHGEVRIGVGAYQQLIRECLRRGIPDDEYHLGIIEPCALPPWEPEEIEPLDPRHLEDSAET